VGVNDTLGGVRSASVVIAIFSVAAEMFPDVSAAVAVQVAGVLVVTAGAL